MTASEGVARAVETAFHREGNGLDYELVRAVLAIEVDSQFNPERSISMSRVSETVEAALIPGTNGMAPSET